MRNNKAVAAQTEPIGRSTTYGQQRRQKLGVRSLAIRFDRRLHCGDDEIPPLLDRTDGWPSSPDLLHDARKLIAERLEFAIEGAELDRVRIERPIQAFLRHPRFVRIGSVDIPDQATEQLFAQRADLLLLLVVRARAQTDVFGVVA